LRPLQLVQEMPQALILQQGLIALHDRGVTLRKRRRKPRLQHFDIGRKLRCGLAHASQRIRFARHRGEQSAA